MEFFCRCAEDKGGDRRMTARSITEHPWRKLYLEDTEENLAECFMAWAPSDGDEEEHFVEIPCRT
jgi:hypothetical protein